MIFFIFTSQIQVHAHLLHNAMKKEIETANDLAKNIKQLIEQSKDQVALSVNTSLSMMYWQIGVRINSEIMQNQRAEYGKKIVFSLC